MRCACGWPKRRAQDVAVELGMLYSTPDVAQGLDALRAAGAQRIVVLPLFPQYSGTTNAAALDQVGRALRSWRFVPELHFAADYAVEPPYIAALAETRARPPAAAWRGRSPAHDLPRHSEILCRGWRSVSAQVRTHGARTGQRTRSCRCGLEPELPVARGPRGMAAALHRMM